MLEYTSTQHIQAPPLMEVLHYSTSNMVTRLNYVRFSTRSATYAENSWNRNFILQLDMATPAQPTPPALLLHWAQPLLEPCVSRLHLTGTAPTFPIMALFQLINTDNHMS